ncbi:hypothetical protein AAEO50_21365, partial [Rossellomorea oryzaecorticis]
HKTNRTGRRSLPSWPVWLMTCASKPCSWTIEERRRLAQLRQAYDEWAGKAFFAFLDHLAYDLEGLAAGAGQ